jgi:hypothetical protein
VHHLGWPALWGIAGVALVLAQALYRLVPIALELSGRSLRPVEIGALAGWLAICVYAEGYRGFHKQFSPRVIARAQHLSAHPRPWLVALAPLFCIGLVHATRKRLVVAWTLTLAIVALVIVVKRLEQPWRGVIDTGVVAGLGIGLVSLGYFAVRALRGKQMPVAPDVPDVSAAAPR